MKNTLAYLKPYRLTVALGLIIKFLGSAAELFLPMILEHMIDDIVPEKNLGRIIFMGVLMLFCAFVALSGNIIANRLSVKSSGKMTHDLRYDLFKKISYLRCGQVDEVSIPSLVSRMTSDSYYVNQMVARTLRIGVRAPILLIGGIVFTFALDPVLACVLAATVPVVGISVFLITRKSVPVYFDVQKSGDKMVRSMQENVAGVRVIKALSRTEYEAEKFGAITDELAEREFKANRLMSLPNPLATLILNLGLVGVIVVGAVRGNSAGTLLAFLSYFTIVLNGLLGLSKIFTVISRGAASAARIDSVLKMDSTESIGEYPRGNAQFKIEFRNVSFSYNKAESNVRNISFALKSGQTLGIIGATGSGKSTLINLMMRFYDADEGQVFIDGRDVREYSPDKLRSCFGAAFQNDFLMAASVKDNIDYGRGLSERDIAGAIDAAQAREFVDGLDGGMDYDLSQKAANLSGGQKQRLLIARALAGKPDILVLDDSSSALDYRTDAELRKALSENYKECTKIIIAQRVSSVMNADLILVMDDGDIIGAGTHGELLNGCGEYGLIYNTQMGGAYGATEN